jgi:type VI secretion system secreted protein Hcp
VALNAYLRLKGQSLGNITGSVTRKGLEGWIAVLAASHDISSPHDGATGQVTGQRIHTPFVITKEVDQASPRLYSALASNELITEWELRFFRRQKMLGATGDVNHYRVTLTNASLVSISLRMANDTNARPARLAEHELVAFTYQQIDWTWALGGVTATDTW